MRKLFNLIFILRFSHFSTQEHDCALRILDKTAIKKVQIILLIASKADVFQVLDWLRIYNMGFLFSIHKYDDWTIWKKIVVNKINRILHSLSIASPSYSRLFRCLFYKVDFCSSDQIVCLLSMICFLHSV